MSDKTTETEEVEETEETEEESTEDETSEEESDAEDDSTDGDDKKLGDKGKQALDRMKAKLKTERERRIAAEAKAAEKDDNAEDDAARKERDAKANIRILKSEIKAAAAGKLADPKDAYKFLDLEQFEVDDDGDVDEEEIADAIDDLIKKKPYLAAQGGRRFKGGADGGTRKESRPKQLTRTDLQGMTPAEIDKAHKEGRLKDLLNN